MFNLSYITVTRNRLSFLKITLEKLLTELSPDEEIVIVDGNSSDGTQEYLQQLYNDRKIHQFISESDINQAHGWNKAMLLARGTIIKKIIDDDVYDYKAIRKCVNYMLRNIKIDVLISNDLASSLNNYKEIRKNSRLSQYNKWRNCEVPSFTFSDVHMLIRRSSLAHIGLYNVGFVMMDWEYALRISYLQANIAFYTGYNALSVYHDQSITALKSIKEITAQGKKANFFYDYPGDRAEISTWSKIKIAIGKIIFSKNPIKQASEQSRSINVIYNHFYTEIELLNSNNDFEFLSNIKP